MYTTKEACEQVGISYETLKFYCIEGSSTIPQRKEMLDKLKDSLLNKMNELNECLNYIDNKQAFYDDVLVGKIEYISNLIDVENL